MVPGVQTVTLTQGLLRYVDEQSEPFTVMGSTLMGAEAVPPVTVSVVDPETFPDLAIIIVVPAKAPEVTRPEPLIVATSVADELHVADVVMSWVVLSEYVPMAVNCCVVPVGMLRFAGVSSMDTSVRAVTVRVIELEVIFPDAAVIVVVPVASEVTSPALLMVATVGVDEFQVTDVVRS